MTKYEADLEDHEPRIVSGVKGMKSTSFSKKFRNQAHMEKWMDSDDFGNHSVQQIERHGSKITKEEADFEDLQELSKGTLGSYVKKAVDGIKDNQADIYRNLDKPKYMKSSEYKDLAKKRSNRTVGITKAVNRLTKEEFEGLDESEQELYELSRDTLQSYVRKSTRDAFGSGVKASSHDGKGNSKAADKYIKRAENRFDGVGRAVSRLTKEELELEEGLRLVKTHTSKDGAKVAKVYRDSEYDEFRVRHFTDGKYHDKADYHTDDAEDAHGTAKHFLKEDLDMENEQELTELSKGTIGSYVRKAKKGLQISKDGLQRMYDYDAEGISGTGPDKKIHRREIKNRTTGIDRAKARLTKEEYDMLPEAEQELYELSKGTLKNYVDAADDHLVDLKSPGSPMSASLDRNDGESERSLHRREAAVNKRWTKNRKAGIKLATKKLTKEEYDMLPEDEQAEYELVEASVAAETLRAASNTAENPKAKVEYMTSMLGAMHGMKKEDLTKWYDQAMALLGKAASSLPAGANAASNKSSINMKEDVEEMFAGEELSEGFMTKATTLFEAAVTAKALTRIAQIEEEYEAALEEEVNEIAEELESNVNAYLDYVVAKWLEENAVAIESSLRNELTEDFIHGMKSLFAEHYIDVPEEKIDVVEELAIKVEELESALDESIREKTELRNELLEAHRAELVAEMSEGLTLLQSDKFLALAEGVSFDGDLEAYQEKLQTVKEAYFAPKRGTTSINEEVYEGNDLTESTKSSDPSVSRYAQAISRTVKR